MCGIAGFHIREKARTAFDPNKLVAELLLAIDHRGGDATGYAAFASDGATQVQKAACDAATFLTGCRPVPADTGTVLLHTRLATQGKAAFPENNHPVVSGSIYAVHNGHIWNDAALFGKLGITRQGRVDSEVIPALVASEGWDNIPTALARLDGDYAVALANEQKPGELVLARGSWSPLCVLASDNLIVWASESYAITRAWSRAIGTSPSYKKIRTMYRGDMLHVTGGKMDWSRFQPMPDAYGIVTTGTYNRPEQCEIIAPSKIDTALAILDERSRGSLKYWTGDDWQTQEMTRGERQARQALDMSVRCACCDEWEHPDVMTTWANELLCPDCLAIMEEELMR